MRQQTSLESIGLCALISGHGVTPALVGGAVSLSYDQLLESIDTVARWIAGKAAVGARAGICTVHGVDLAVLSLALNRCGINVFLAHPGTSRETMIAMAAAEQARVLITDFDCRGESWVWAGELPEVHCGFKVSVWTNSTPVAPLDEAPAVHLYTSGTEGVSKGVVRGQTGLLREVSMLAEVLGFRQGEAVLCPVSLSSSYGFVIGLLTALASGASLVIERPVSGAHLLRQVRAHDLGGIIGTPAFYDLWCRGLSEWPLLLEAQLRRCVSAGSTLSPRTRRRFHEVWARRIASHYGMTECGALTLEREPSDAERSVGTPLPGVRFRIESSLDGEAGELVASSPYIGVRYVDGSALWHEGGDGSPEVRTGDLGHIHRHGVIAVLGRSKDQINVHGLKVDPIEIEELIKADPQVSDVAVVGVDLDNDDQVVVACVVCADYVTDDVISATYRTTLPSYKQPKKIIRVAAIPRTSSGKIRRRVLYDMARAEHIAPSTGGAERE